MAVCWLITLERISYERAETVTDAERQNSNLALAFEEHTLHAIKRADQAVTYLKREYERERRVADLRELAAEGEIDSALVPNRLITDADGNVLDAYGRPGPVNVADRDFFESHRRNPGGALWIAKPFMGRVTGLTVISISRSLIDFDGNFLGVVAVGLDPDYFLGTYKKFDLGPDGLIQLVGLDGVVRARRQGERVSSGADMRDSIVLRRALEAPAGRFVSPGQSDGIPRFQSYRVLKGYPLVVSVGMSVDHVLAKFHSRARGYYLAAAAVTICILAAGGGLVFLLRRRRRATDELAASESLYRATFERAAIGVAHTGLDGAFLKVNRKCCEMLGYSEEELLARSFADITHPEDLARSRTAVKDLIAAGAPVEFEKRYLRKDGSVVWAAVAAAVVRAAGDGPDYFVTVLQDITARRNAEAQLLEQLDELRRFQKVTVDRELRMIELEAQLRALREKAAA